MNISTVLLAIVICFCFVQCTVGFANCGEVNAGESPDIKQLVATICNENLEGRERIAAASMLGKVKLSESEKRMVNNTLIKLLPGKLDAITLEIIRTLGVLGDDNALKKLKEIQDLKNVSIPGKLNAVLDSAISKIEQRYPIEAAPKSPPPPK